MLVLNAEPVAGMTIGETIRDALELSNKTNCLIKIIINDIPIIISDNPIFGYCKEARIKYFYDSYYEILNNKNRKKHHVRSKHR